MSIFGAMQSGISALASQSSSMGAISDNIANVNTVGYKSNSVAFSTLVTKQSSSSLYSPGGVQSKPKQSISAQGLLSATSNSTDVAISGSGYLSLIRRPIRAKAISGPIPAPAVSLSMKTAI